MDTIFPVRLLSQLRPLLIGFRKSKELTQRELSAMLGVTQQTYARLEANPSKASFERRSEWYFHFVTSEISIRYIVRTESESYYYIHSSEERNKLC